MLADFCPSDKTTFQGPKSNEDIRELFAHDLRPALEFYDELAEVYQVPQNAVAATETITKKL